MTLSKGTWILGEPLDADKSGMGRVFHAQDEQGAPAVAKLVPQDPGAERELLMGDSLRASSARNVIAVLDHGEHDGEWVIIMPRAEKSLAQHLKQQDNKPLDPAEVVKVLTDVATALSDLAALEPAIIHRDIKPQNILLLDNTWQLCDFGIARYAEATTAADTQKFKWTLPYAAPEQWRMERATAATDVYALGAVGYQLLAGRLPFPGPDFREQHLGQNPAALVAGTARLRSIIEECLWKPAPARPSPSNLLARLATAAAEPSRPGASRLAKANQAEAARLATDHASAVAAEERAEAAERLFEAAEQALPAIVDPLMDAIRTDAPIATMQMGYQNVMYFLATLRGAKIGVSKARRSYHDGPFTVIASAVVSVNMSPARNGYEGRAHSLWYCDAQEAGRFAWYETAFMTVMSQASDAVLPYSLFPNEAADAIRRVMNTRQVAWPFEELDRADPVEFVDRWIDWFAQAVERQLYYPSNMPEKPTGGSWRM
ncbi:serine/threonine protein kinase [Kribbella sp. NBC_00662]|uniref:serine/threonine-protein kinase n=1 Tax=Kribbella sp. NBC_00662 TaxID=2975969 RepID=UPI0032487A9D